MNSQSFKCFFSPSRLLQQKAMITIKNDIVASDVLLWLHRTFTILSDQSGMDAICFTFFLIKCTSEGATIWAGSKMECVQLCNFQFYCAFIFCQPIKVNTLLSISKILLLHLHVGEKNI